MREGKSLLCNYKWNLWILNYFEWKAKDESLRLKGTPEMTTYFPLFMSLEWGDRDWGICGFGFGCISLNPCTCTDYYVYYLQHSTTEESQMS